MLFVPMMHGQTIVKSFEVSDTVHLFSMNERKPT
jgi:hypothetical protein